MIKEISSTYKEMNAIEKIGSMLFISILIFIQIITNSSIISFICTFLGIFYVLGVKYQTKFSLSIGAVQTFTYSILAFNNGVYGDLILNIYSCLTLLYGYFIWSKEIGEHSFEIKKLDKNKVIKLLCATVLVYFSMYLFLNFLGGYRPYLDSFNSTMSIVALFLTMKKYRSAWIYWNLNNISSFILYLVMYMDGKQVAPMLLLFFAYTLNSLHAMYIWYKKK